MCLIINGLREALPGVPHAKIRNFLDEPKLAVKNGMGAQPRPPGTVVSGIVLHTTKGKVLKGPPKPGFGKFSNAAEKVVAWWGKPENKHGRAGAHLLIDADGTISCLADLQGMYTWHAKAANKHTIGIEILQLADGTLYEGQLQTVVTLLDHLTRRFGIQRQFHAPYVKPEGSSHRLHTGADFVGIFGHRDQTHDRGPGCPGHQIFDLLKKAGYESFDANALVEVTGKKVKGADRVVWAQRQVELNAKLKLKLKLVTDGIPGLKTRDALTSLGKPYGMWAFRPGDDDKSVLHQA